MNPGGAPRHVAIITDGNGRWAAQRGLPPIAGHDAGADVVRECMKNCVRLGVQQLTVYSFSTENWSRPPDEVEGLLRLFTTRLRTETPEMIEHGVRLRFVGSREGVPQQLLDRMDEATEATAAGELLEFFVAFNYGGRAEILLAAERYEGGGEEAFRQLLHVPELRDPDLVIRTSGEQRLSNFLLWQSAYAELVFRDELWPDFTRRSLIECFAEYTHRQRRFGGRTT